MGNQSRILGNIVGKTLTKEDLDLISIGGTGCDPHTVCCNGCQSSTPTDDGNGPGCKCD